MDYLYEGVLREGEESKEVKWRMVRGEVQGVVPPELQPDLVLLCQLTHARYCQQLDNVLERTAPMPRTKPTKEIIVKGRTSIRG